MLWCAMKSCIIALFENNSKREKKSVENCTMSSRMERFINYFV